MSGAGPLDPQRYVLRQVRARPTRSALIVLGVAIAVGSFVLFGSMSAGLSGYITEELDRPHAANLYLESGSPTPFDSGDVFLISIVALQSQEASGVAHHTTTRAQLPVSSEAAATPIWLWGIDQVSNGTFMTPPYDTVARLLSGRHLDPGRDFDDPDNLSCVLGHEAFQALFPSATVGSTVSIGPDASVDPWWLLSAADYPIEGKTQVTALPRGPVGARVVGVLAPGQGEELDNGIFVPIKPLLQRLDQWETEPTGGLLQVYYPQVVVTVEDATRVDLDGLEADLAAVLPGIAGTDDAWDAEGFESTYGSAARALEVWLAVITTVMVVMLVAGVSDTTLVAVTDRRREIATLRAVGIRRRMVSRLVVEELLLLSVIGLALGLLGGGLVAWLFGHLHDTTGGSGVFIAPVSLSAWVLVGAVALALGSATLASAYPAHRASGQSPTEALRYE